MDSSTTTELHLKHIALDDVRQGMFLADVFDARGHLLLSANQPVQSDAQIQKLRQRGVTSVYINISKGRDTDSEQSVGADTNLPSPEQHARIMREQAYYDELPRARHAHQHAATTTRELLKAVRLGKAFSTGEVHRSSEGVVQSVMRNPDALVSLVQIKGYDEYTFTHSVNVGILLTSLAHEMGYTQEQLMAISMGGILHDIGKMRVPEVILNKPGKLTEQEFALMQRHPEYGLGLVEDKKNIAELSRAVIIQHHERFNGRGYPNRLTAQQIEEVGLMSAVADVYDALTSDRVYKQAWTPQRALALIFQGCDEDYSRMVVERFTRHLGVYPVGSFVRLSSGEMGVVTKVDRGNLLNPTLLLLFDAQGKRLAKPTERDLAAPIPQGAETGWKVQISLDPKDFEVRVAEYLQGKIPLSAVG